MRHKTTTLNNKATTRLISTQLEAVSERSGGGRPPHEVHAVCAIRDTSIRDKF